MESKLTAQDVAFRALREFGECRYIYHGMVAGAVERICKQNQVPELVTEAVRLTEAGLVALGFAKERSP
jgi:hypothetical protein